MGREGERDRGLSGGGHQQHFCARVGADCSQDICGDLRNQRRQDDTSFDVESKVLQMSGKQFALTNIGLSQRHLKDIANDETGYNYSPTAYTWLGNKFGAP